MKNAHTFSFEGYDFRFFDSTETSFAVANILREVPAYRLDTISFEAGDIMIDIGSHCGVISIVAAKCHPEIEVYSFEPNPANFETFLKNIQINEVSNITPVQKAVTSDGRDLQIKVKHQNTGGGSAYKEFQGVFDEEYSVTSIRFDEIFSVHDIERCKLLKLDCEGAEHEIILGESCLDRVQNLTGEFHMNQTLKSRGYSIDETVKRARQRVSGQVITHRIRMVD